MRDDLIGLILGCGCRRRCCCDEPPTPEPDGGGNLFAQSGRGTPPLRVPEETPFIPVLQSFDSPQRAGVLSRTHRPIAAPEGWDSEVGPAAPRVMTFDDARGFTPVIPQDAQRIVDHVERVVRWGDVFWSNRVVAEEVWTQDAAVRITKNLGVGYIPGNDYSYGLSPEQQELGQPVPFTTFSSFQGGPEDRGYAVTAGSPRTFPVETQSRRGGSATWAGAVDPGGEILTYRDSAAGVMLSYQLSRVTAGGGWTSFTPPFYRVEAVREVQPFEYFRARLFGWRPTGTYHADDPGDWEEIPYTDTYRGRVALGYGPALPPGTVLPPELIRRQGQTDVYVSLPIHELYAVTETLPGPPLRGAWPQRFRAPDVEVTPGGDTPLPALGRLGPTVVAGVENTTLHVNGRAYDKDGSWTGLLGPSGEHWLLIEQEGVCLREVIGQPEALESAPAAQVCAALRLPPGRVTWWGDSGYHTWPMDRAGATVTTSGSTFPVLVTAWDAWRDSTRQQWPGRPRRPPDRAKAATWPPELRPPLDITLADVTPAGGQWEPALRGGSPHVLPLRVEMWRDGVGWEESEAALAALAKPLSHGAVAGVLDDRTTVRGRLRVTFPPHPAAVAYTRQPDTVLHARVRWPVSAAARVNGLVPEVRILGQAVRRDRQGTLRPLRGWQPALIIVQSAYEPAAGLALEIEGLALARLLLTPAGVNSGGGGQES